MLLQLKYKTSVIRSKQISRDIKLGEYVRLYENVYVGHNCSIGDYTYINPNSFIDDNTTIGKYCSISRNVMIGLGNHELDGITTHPIGYSSDWNEYITQSTNEMRTTKVGNDVWIGAGVIILNGVTINDGAVLAAGAVVTKDVESYTIVGGVPAKFIKHRSFEKHDTVDKWWDLPIDEIKRLMESYQRGKNDNE